MTLIFGICHITIRPTGQTLPADRFSIAYAVKCPFGLATWLGKWVFA